MDRGYWDNPVTIETLTLGRYRTVSSTAEAARVLLEEWPVDEGEAFVAAKTLCLAVMEGNADPEEARKAFLIAADETDVFVRP
ncbi:DUF982 domain-containing protein [Shinella granuli]|uniref:Uncharacterized protein DUF982 n=1 Tax=Shinella granuli TaxID=323621 RepID=A0A4R2CK53_SHIGR|nr:DUF982 domain-containing protein [Shinella granuli]TCN41447.1 uncharacterized protein DUF982 [Shinella granuli]